MPFLRALFSLCQNYTSMQTSVKSISYCGNLKAKSAESLVLDKLKEDGLFSTGLNVMFAFLIVIGLSMGLRVIESNFFMQEPTNHLAVKAAYASEVTNAATLASQSHTSVNIKPENGFTFTLSYTNTGTSTWTKEDVFLKSSTTALKFRHEFWPDAYLPAQLQEETVAPGEIGSFKFALQAPTNLNKYTGEFLLVNNNILIKGTQVTVAMNVVEDPSAVQVVKAVAPTTTMPATTAPTDTQAAASVCSLNLTIASAIGAVDNETCKISFGLPEQGPDMRVGLFHTEESISITNTKAWQVYDATDTLLASVPANQVVTFFYINSKGEYAFDFIDKTIRSNSYLKISNFNDGLFTVTSLEDRPSWNLSINYNDFIGDLEIRHNDYKDRTWLIEILPLEEYVMGIKETSNSDPLEYLKAMSVAARTYALYHHESGRKHAKEFFDVDSYYDQVYKGQVVRVIMPKLEQAVRETAGQVVTYDNEIIVAAYFSHSDGRTRSFQEVWGSNVPYLISVPTPYTADLELWGHGVGIDATDARAHVRKDNWTYDQIIKYYYTKVLLEEIY